MRDKIDRDRKKERVRKMERESEKDIYIQWKPLNVITLGQIKTDNIKRMITISK
jgi:hypothetical protein